MRLLLESVAIMTNSIEGQKILVAQNSSSNPDGTTSTNTYPIEPKGEMTYLKADGYVFYGTAPDGTICASETTCNGVPTVRKLELLDPRSTGACGEYVCVEDGKIPFNRHFNNPPYDISKIDMSATPSSVPDKCDPKTAVEAIRKLQMTDDRFNRQNVYFWATAPYIYMRSLGIPIEDFGILPWVPVNIKIDTTDPMMCNAAMDSSANMAVFGNCSATFKFGDEEIKRTMNAASDGSIVSHEVGGHGAIGYINPNIGKSYDDFFGSGLHESSDLPHFFITGDPRVGEDYAPIIYMLTNEGNPCWLRRVDVLKPLTQNSSLECHNLSENLSPFFAHVAYFLQKNGVEPQKARDVAALIWYEHFIYLKVYPITPKDILAATIESAKNLFETGMLFNDLQGKVSADQLIQEIKDTGEGLGFNSYRMPTLDPKAIGKDAIYGNISRAVALSGNRTATVRNEFFVIGNGMFNGKTLRVEGGGETTITSKDGGTKVIRSYNGWFAKLSKQDKTNLGKTITLSKSEAANFIGAPAVFNAINNLGQKGQIKWSRTTISRLFQEFTNALGNKKDWAEKGELVVPYDGGGVYYKFTVGPFVIYADASGRRPLFLGRSVFD